MEDPKDKKANIERESLNKEDDLLFRIKYGYAPPFRMEKYIDYNDPLQVRYVLTNIPKEDDDD